MQKKGSNKNYESKLILCFYSPPFQSTGHFIWDAPSVSGISANRTHWHVVTRSVAGKFRPIPAPVSSWVAWWLWVHSCADIPQWVDPSPVRGQWTIRKCCSSSGSKYTKKMSVLSITMTEDTLLISEQSAWFILWYSAYFRTICVIYSAILCLFQNNLHDLFCDTLLISEQSAWFILWYSAYFRTICVIYSAILCLFQNNLRGLFCDTLFISEQSAWFILWYSAYFRTICVVYSVILCLFQNNLRDLCCDTLLISEQSAWFILCNIFWATLTNWFSKILSTRNLGRLAFPHFDY